MTAARKPFGDGAGMLHNWMFDAATGEDRGHPAGDARWRRRHRDGSLHLHAIDDSDLRDRYVFHRPFHVFAGIAGTRNYAGFESGKLRYLSAQLAKSTPARA
jgi:hypothetical protein